jgi:hypothetical protein
MFIRWQTRARSRRCILVEALRIDGQPKQRHIAYLGSIADGATAAQRRIFWQHVDASFRKLKLPTAERQRLEAIIAMKVRRPRLRLPLEEPLPQPRPVTKRS